MGLRIGIIGAGAVGGYVGGQMALAGTDVTLIGQWAQHVEHIKRDGLRLAGTQGEQVVRPPILHVHEVQELVRRPLDAAILCVKSYDTEWATALMAQYLSPAGFVVSMQNGMNEERMAAIVGWDRVLGVVLSTIGVNSTSPGVAVRTTRPGGDAHTVFRVGEPHGRVTHRALEVARLLSAVDSAAVTTNLWGERWSKLVANSISHGLSAITGLNSRGLLESEALRRVTVKLAAEGVAVGHALGYCLVGIYGAAAESWLAANSGDTQSAREVDSRLVAGLSRLTDDERPSVAHDILRGRRTEIDFTSGLIVQKAKTLGIPTPTQDAVLALVRRVERGEIAQDPRHVAGIA